MRIAILISRAGPTNAPLFRNLANQAGMDLTVYYCSDIGVGKADFDVYFNRPIDWGTSILEGYKYRFLKNLLPIKFSSKNDAWFNPQIVWELVRNRYDAIVVYGWNSFTDWLVFFTAFLIKTPILLWGENPLNQELTKKGIKIKLKQGLLRWLFRRISSFLYIGKENRKFYEYLGVPESKLFFTPYATNNELVLRESARLKSQKAGLRKKIGLFEESVVILFVGRFMTKKNPLDLLKAYETLTSKPLSQSVSLVFVGEGLLRAELENYTKDKKLENVFFVGFRGKPEIYEYYAIADIFVLPSGVGETWGLVVNEAMCFGLPVIVADIIGCAPDLARPDENGFIFPTGDLLSLSQKLEDLTRDASKRKKFGDQSRDIINNYSHEKDVEGIVRALEFSIGH